jgi:hypothetical protein
VANIRRNICYPLSVPPRTCRVTLRDTRGIEHSIEVVAETLFEAAILGLRILRADTWVEQGISAATKIEAEVREPETKHAVTLQQIERWLIGARGTRSERGPPSSTGSFTLHHSDGNLRGRSR